MIIKTNSNPGRFRSLIMLAICIVFAGCSQRSPTPEPATVQIAKQSQDNIGVPSDTAAAEHQKPIIQNPEDYQLALEAMAVKNYGTAQTLFESFKNKNPKLSGAYLNLAVIALQENQLSIAENLISQAITINSNKPEAYHLRAQIHLKIGQIKEARNDYEKALLLDPKYSIAHYNIALLYDIYLQDIALAIEHYSIYLSLIDKDDEETRQWIKHLKGSINNG